MCPVVYCSRMVPLSCIFFALPSLLGFFVVNIGYVLRCFYTYIRKNVLSYI